MKIKVTKRSMIILCLFAIAILFLTVGSIYNRQARKQNHSITIQAKEEGFDLDLLKSMMKDPESEYTFSAWKEEADQQISAFESGRSSAADVITVYGPSQCVLPYGKNLQAEDTEGCLLGMKLAEELFGSHKVEGQKLVYGERVLTVRGVINNPENLMICEAAEELSEQAILFPRISILSSDKEDLSLITSNFMNQYGLSGQALRFDVYQNLSWIKELIPGKWADFDGWKANIEDKRQEIELVKNTEKSEIEAIYLSSIRNRNRYIGLGIVCIGTAFAVMRCRFFGIDFHIKTIYNTLDMHLRCRDRKKMHIRSKEKTGYFLSVMTIWEDTA